MCTYHCLFYACTAGLRVANCLGSSLYSSVLGQVVYRWLMPPITEDPKVFFTRRVANATRYLSHAYTRADPHLSFFGGGKSTPPNAGGVGLRVIIVPFVCVFFAETARPMPCPALYLYSCAF